MPDQKKDRLLFLPSMVCNGVIEFETSEGKQETNAWLPKGCVGIMYVFDSEQAAKEFFGGDVEIKYMRLPRRPENA
jgi:hypothetical protein